MRRLRGAAGWFLTGVGLTYILLAAAAGMVFR